MTAFFSGRNDEGDEAPAPSDDSYERHKKRAAARQRKQSAAAREVTPIPAVKDPDRKARAIAGFRTFCESYFPYRFPLAWSENHLRVIAAYQRIVTEGGLKAIAMPRGEGKTNLAEVAVLWAVFRGSRRFVALIGATAEKAEDLLTSIKNDLETNDLLYEDFPEILHPIRALEGTNQRKPLHEGERIRMTFKSRFLVLPNLPVSPAASAVIRVAGLESGGIRGLSYPDDEGRKLRPDMVILDDPQTDESACSSAQCDSRQKLITGAVLGLAGPNVKISAFMLVTVIRTGDLADHFLSHAEQPEWEGIRTKMLISPPSNGELWDRYRKVRNDGLASGDGGAAGNAFYAAHREPMDEGGAVSWTERRKPDELSALQSAMNLKFRNERTFAAEYQNEPLPDAQEGDVIVTAEAIREKLSHLPRRVVPVELPTLAAFFDVGKRVLWWAVCAWGRDFSGSIIDYGAWPPQDRDYFTAGDVRPTLEDAYPNRGEEGCIYQGLWDCTDAILKTEWPIFGNSGVARISRCLIDAGKWPDIIYQVCRQSPHAAIMLPSLGRGLKATSRPMEEYREGPGEEKGHHWFLTRGDARRAVPHVLVDVNYWKSHVHRRLATAIGDPGALTLFGDDTRTHAMIADHLTAEVRITTKRVDQTRTVDEWQLPPHKPDNHLLDCVVGCAVAASMQGVSMPEWLPTREELPYVDMPKVLGVW